MMEKKLTNSGPFMESTGKHSIYTPIICVDEATRFPPHHGLRKYCLLFFVRLLREPLDSRTARHVTQGRDIA
jgi:hypothetical protein